MAPRGRTRRQGGQGGAASQEVGSPPLWRSGFEGWVLGSATRARGRGGTASSEWVRARSRTEPSRVARFVQEPRDRVSKGGKGGLLARALLLLLEEKALQGKEQREGRGTGPLLRRSGTRELYSRAPRCHQYFLGTHVPRFSSSEYPALHDTVKGRGRGAGGQSLFALEESGSPKADARIRHLDSAHVALSTPGIAVQSTPLSPAASQKACPMLGHPPQWLALDNVSKHAKRYPP